MNYSGRNSYDHSEPRQSLDCFHCFPYSLCRSSILADLLLHPPSNLFDCRPSWCSSSPTTSCPAQFFITGVRVHFTFQSPLGMGHTLAKVSSQDQKPSFSPDAKHNICYLLHLCIYCGWWLIITSIDISRRRGFTERRSVWHSECTFKFHSCQPSTLFFGNEQQSKGRRKLCTTVLFDDQFRDAWLR